MVKTMKYQVVCPIDTTWDEFGKVLRSLRYETRQIMNKTIQNCWWFENQKFEFKKLNGIYPKDEEILDGNKFGKFLYKKLVEEFKLNNTGNLSQAYSNALKKFKDCKTDIYKGEMSIPSYRDNNPIYLHNNSIKLELLDSKYYLTLSLLSNNGLKELNQSSGRFKILINDGDNSSKMILNRCIEESYDISASMILFDDRKKKWFFALCYSFKPLENTNLDENKILGIDMGVKYPVYMTINEGFARTKIDGGEVENFRKGIERRKNELFRQGKYCGDGRIGHGIKTRIKPIEFAQSRVANFRDTCNHKYSRFIISYALRLGCGTIQMEDLKGINEFKEKKFLKDWTYFDLQSKIEYKAKENGIKVKKINPQYTSQRCSVCGHIEKENRETQEKFLCKNCGFETNADYNAAKNISNKDIENLINEELKKCE